VITGLRVLGIMPQRIFPIKAGYPSRNVIAILPYSLDLDQDQFSLSGSQRHGRHALSVLPARTPMMSELIRRGKCGVAVTAVRQS
jgi:hypothetical protein